MLRAGDGSQVEHPSNNCQFDGIFRRGGNSEVRKVDTTQGMVQSHGRQRSCDGLL